MMDDILVNKNSKRIALLKKRGAISILRTIHIACAFINALIALGEEWCFGGKLPFNIHYFIKPGTG
ncbi:MAG TPA: hypothetical protein VGD17_07220 [Chitinophagaceae bacterium]